VTTIIMAPKSITGMPTMPIIVVVIIVTTIIIAMAMVNHRPGEDRRL